MAFDVDFFVIGAGSGGVRSARIAAGHGEDARGGGRPDWRRVRHPRLRAKEVLRYASRFADDFRDAAEFGWTVGQRPSIGQLWSRPRTRRSPGFPTPTARIWRGPAPKFVEQRATVVDPHRVRFADGREISAGHS